MQDKIVVVTGAFGFLGRSVAEALHRQGARVAALDFSDAAPPALTALLQGRGYIKGGLDIAQPSQASAAAAEVAASLGEADALINIAGGFAWETTEDGQFETWGRLFRMNVETAVSASRAFLPHIRRSKAGRIINIGAAAAVRAAAGMGPYAASKAGVMRFTESLAEELKPDTSITVNAILPSIIDTPANRQDMPDADATKWVSPADLAATILFLLSPEAQAITGALIPVTGRV